jgi:VIT1/CCC1 family predicted Fe2+/Mn2+ transporter
MISSRRHNEQHFRASNVVHDTVIGMADGLTVPFAIAAGMSGAMVTPHVVIIAGLAEIAAGSISMGLGGYLSGLTDVQHYRREREREVRETFDVPKEETREVSDILKGFGLNRAQAEPIVKALTKNRQRWVDFMMRFELGLETPSRRQALKSAATIGGAYAVSGFIPLAPYFAARPLSVALIISAVVTMTALLVFGFVKGRLTGVGAVKSALQTALVGGVAASAAFGIARVIS